MLVFQKEKYNEYSSKTFRLPNEIISRLEELTKLNNTSVNPALFHFHFIHIPYKHLFPLQEIFSFMSLCLDIGKVFSLCFKKVISLNFTTKERKIIEYSVLFPEQEMLQYCPNRCKITMEDVQNEMKNTKD